LENNKNRTPASGKPELPLDDERRVKTLSPGAMTAKRFFRNRLAVAGLIGGCGGGNHQTTDQSRQNQEYSK
jgi:hypothetical protein